MVSEVMGQPLKAQSPMLVTELGTVSEVSEQPLKADSPILVTEFGFNLFATGLIISGMIASFTIGGKALGKSFAINKSQIILYQFAKFVSNFYH